MFCSCDNLPQYTKRGDLPMITKEQRKEWETIWYAAVLCWMPFWRGFTEYI